MNCKCINYFCADWKVSDHVTHEKSGRIYGHRSKDEPIGIRMKLGLLGFYQAPLVAFRMVYRVFTLLSGDFVRTGLEKANRINQLALQKWSKKTENSFYPALRQEKMKQVLWQLTKNIAKIVVYPLALIANLFICVYGMFDPYGGRAIYAEIEETLSSNGLLFRKGFGETLHLLGEAAICMKPRDVYDRIKIQSHRVLNDPDSPQYLLPALRCTLADKHEFFKSEGIDVSALLDTLIKNDMETQNVIFEKDRIKLCQIRDALNSIESIRWKIINNCLSNNFENSVQLNQIEKKVTEIKKAKLLRRNLSKF